MIRELLEKQKKSIYRLSKETGISYSALYDVCNNKHSVKRCSAEVIYKISKALDVSMEELVEDSLEEKRPSFENFKGTICHRVKAMGEIDFLIAVLEDDMIGYFFRKEWYRECFYLLAMTDYLSKKNNVPLCDEYNEIRKLKLENIIYPEGILLLYNLNIDKSILKKAREESIPEFMKYNIVEKDIEDVV